MAGGDLLYIFAFIILPTTVLVSCIWALILLRNGVLLPGRPARQRDISQLENNLNDTALSAPDPVEETGEHEVLAPAPIDSAPVASLPVAPVRAVTEPASLALPTNTPRMEELQDDTPHVANEPPSDAPPATERTQELQVAPVDVPAVDDHGDRSVAREALSAEREPAAVADDAGARSVTPELDAATPAPAEAASVLIVPLDEPSGAPATVSPTATSGTTSAPQRAAPRVATDDAMLPDQPSARPSGSRGPGRWDAPARPVDEQSGRARAAQRRNARRFGA